MIKARFEKAKQPKAVEALLKSVDHLVLSSPEATAYNTLLEYLEYPDWYQTHEGDRLVRLSIEVLSELLANSNTDIR